MTVGPDITALLADWKAGNPEAEQQLFQALYPSLRQMAQRQFQRAARGDVLTLQATELIGEAYMQLVRQKNGYVDRNHFFAIAARIVRRVVIDHLRDRMAQKRGGKVQLTSLEDAAEVAALDPQLLDALSIEKALTELEQHDPECARMVELRFYGGLSTLETAAALGVSESTVMRQWRFARAWIERRL